MQNIGLTGHVVKATDSLPYRSRNGAQFAS